MKKIFITTCILLITVQAHALCSLDSDNNICTVSDIGNKTNLNLIQNENLINVPQEELPAKQTHESFPFNSNINTKQQQLQYDSACQFGVCVQDLNNINNKTQ